MPLIFRGINKARWNQQKHQEEYNWLKAGEIPAETFVDVVRKDIQENELSVYLIDDNETSLNRMIAAFATSKDYVDKLDYKVIDYDVLLSAGFKFKETLGDTADHLVNTWHRDLHQLTASNLLEFIHLLYFETENQRKTKKGVEQFIVQSIRDKNIIESEIRSEKMREKIEELKTKYP